MRRVFNAHLSISGGLHLAIDKARDLRMDCVQVFTKNQRQWRAPTLREEQVSAWEAARERAGWLPRERVVAHNSYLINMASPDDDAWKRSVGLQRVELERCEALGIAWLVAHPGAHLYPTGSPPRKPGEPNDLERTSFTRDELRGLRRIGKALNQLHRDLPGYRVITCLETTVGSGSNLGYSFHHLAWLRDHVREPERVGFCLDTCHVTAAGYDMSTEDRAGAVLERFDDICGLEHLLALHLNDSQGAIGSRKDRHAHIGEGSCGRACFRAIVNHPLLGAVPKILETPKGEDDRGRDLDVVNIQRLKRMGRPRMKKPIA